MLVFPFEDKVIGIKLLYQKFTYVCPNKRHCAYKAVHDTGHGVYFLAAAMESHGFYAQISIILLGVLIWGILSQEEV